jgi:glyoxylase-like metal-dependent hydrolase (beta-lactamase superfamily II)
MLFASYPGSGSTEDGMRLFLLIVAGVVGVAVVGVAAIVGPALMQVRGVEPPLPSEAELRELLRVEDGPVRVRYVNTSSQAIGDRTLGHTVFLVEWANGDLFMIDAGMDRKQAVEFGGLMETLLGAEPARPHGSIAERLGPDVERVKGVAYTHLHIDHSQGTLPFCEARGRGARVFQTRWQAELHNYNTEEGAAIVADSCLAPGSMSGETILRPDGFPGLGIVALGGHTPGSTLFVVPIDGRLWLFSGDITNTKQDLLTNTGKPFLYSYLMVPEHTARNEALRLWLAELDGRPDIRVVVSHDLDDVVASGMPEVVRP